MGEPLRVEVDGSVETWTLNRPETMNAISDDDIVDALVEHIARVGGDTDVRAVVLTGAGRAFSAGGDVAKMAAGTGLFGHPPAQQRNAYRYGIQRIPLALDACEVPFVAAVNGPAIGAGCDLAMMCDLRIASTAAFFAESFVKVGLVPGDGGAWFLPRVVGATRAAEMTLTGDRVDAATALDWGMVSRVVEPDDLLAAARDLAQRVAVNPPAAVRMSKRLLRESQRGTLGSVLELAAALQAIAHSTEDHHTAAQEFVDRSRSRREGR